MDAVLGDINIADPSADADMEDIAPSSVAKQEKKSKDKKKEKSGDKEGKKDKKRRHSEAVNGTEAEGGEKKKKKRKSE
jgi:nucleolar protein 56